MDVEHVVELRERFLSLGGRPKQGDRKEVAIFFTLSRLWVFWLMRDVEDCEADRMAQQ